MKIGSKVYRIGSGRVGHIIDTGRTPGWYWVKFRFQHRPSLMDANFLRLRDPIPEVES